MLAIGAATGAASFTHVHNVAAAHGQPGWLAWADAIVLELMSVASGLELRRRKRAQISTRFPAVVLCCAVTLSLAAQVVEAEPSPVGWIAAAVPALGFLVMVKVALGYTSRTRPSGTEDTRSTTEPPDRHPPSATTKSGSTPWSGSPPRDIRDSSRTDRRHATSIGGPSAPSVPDVRDLLPAARQVRSQLAADRQPLTRGALAQGLRAAGYTVSNTRMSSLLKILKTEPGPTAAHQPTSRAETTQHELTARTADTEAITSGRPDMTASIDR